MRIGRISRDEDGMLDEVVCSGPIDMVHLERMDRNDIWIGISSGRQRLVVRLRATRPRRGGVLLDGIAEQDGLLFAEGAVQ